MTETAQLEITNQEEQAVERLLWSILADSVDPGDARNVDEWAEENIILSPRVTRFSGPLKLDRTAYMRGPLRAYTHPKCRRTVLVWAAQTGKTLVLQITLAYDIDQDPGPCFIVYPSKTTAKRRSRKHLRPLIEDCPVLAKHMTGYSDDMQTFEYALDTMTATIGYAGSVDVLASEPIRLLKRDEIGKWKRLDKEEGDPLKLSEVRTTSYADMARILDASTPNIETGHPWIDLEGSTWHECWVPCPHCGKPDDVKDLGPVVIDCADFPAIQKRLEAAGYQVLVWEQITGWGKDRAPEVVRKLAHYECRHCHQPINDGHKHAMNLARVWFPKQPEKIPTGTFGFHLPAWYRELPSTTFGRLAAEFFEAKDDPIALQDWLNNRAARPFKPYSIAKSKDEVLHHCREYAEDTIPFVPVFILVTADLRAPEIHYVVRAYGEYETGALLRYGVLARPKEIDPNKEPTGETLSPLDIIRAKTFRCAVNGKEYGVNLTVLDSGWLTDEVYAYCRKRPGCVPAKGVESQRQTIAYSRPEKLPGSNETDPKSILLVEFASDYFKDVLHGKMAVTKGSPGEWMLHATTGDDYAYQVIAEQKVEKQKKNGRIYFEWKQLHKQNHWLDCEVIQCAVARAMDIKSMKVPEDQKPETVQDINPASLLGRDVTGFSERFRR